MSLALSRTFRPDSNDTELTVLLATEGLTAGNDKMPIDQGIKTELPDQKIR